MTATYERGQVGYVPAAVAGVATLGSVVLVLYVGADWAGLLFLAAIGAPLTVLLLAAAAARTPRLGSLVPSILLGGTVVPFLAILFYFAFSTAVYGLIEPLAEAGRSLLDELNADPDLLDALTSPWALVLLIELAVLAPLVEESLKPLGALLRRPRSARDAFMFGAAAGAGFAAAENLLYASGAMYSNDAWVAISVMRSLGAGVHLLGCGLVSLAVYRIRHEGARWGLGARFFGIAVAVHALWNGAIAVATILYNEREYVAGGLSGSALSWGIGLSVALGVLGVLVLGGVVLAARRLGTGEEVESGWLGLERPAGIAAWAAVGASMLVPAIILLKVFPDFLAL
jgi:RsiW-degrading membrane proteinase PrsW (M82 family)